MSSDTQFNLKNTQGSFQDDSSHKNIVKPQNPLLNYMVIQTVFNYLQVPELKICRLVCHRWKYVSTSKLLCQSMISLDSENIENLRDIRAWMDSTSIKWFQHFSFYKITHNSYPNILFLLGNHVKSFHITHWWGDCNDLSLADYEDVLLKRCHNLEEITIASVATCKKAGKFLKSITTQNKTNNNVTTLKLKRLKVIGNSKPDFRFWRLLTVSPNLESLRIDCKVTEEFWNPQGYRAKNSRALALDHLKNLEVRAYANESVSECSNSYFTSQPWTLNKLTLECYNNLSDAGLHSGFTHISTTLKDVYLILFNRECNQWPMDNSVRTFLPYPIMINMEKFQLEIDDHCRGYIHCQNLIASIQFPRLKSLCFSIFENNEANEEDWPDGLFGEMLQVLAANLESDTSLTCDTLECLTLPPKFQDLSCIVLLTTTFPNLKELSLDIPKAVVVSHVFLCCPRLERFSLTLTNEYRMVGTINFIINWNSVLTGQYLSEAMTESLGQSSIRNLQDLKYLEITMKGDESTYLTDVVVCLGLLYLTKIQHLNISGHKFSENALLTLRKQYYPFCHFEL